MTDPIRMELLTVLAQLSSACPEMRFGQLIANLSTIAKGLFVEGLWDAEDDELLAAARQQLQYFSEHRGTGVQAACVSPASAASDTPSAAK